MTPAPICGGRWSDGPRLIDELVRNAEEIAEAASQPMMRFVNFKSQEQLDIQTLHRVRSRLAELTREHLKRGVHRSTAELEADIAAFIAAHNQNPKPYNWAKSADEILASVKRFCQKTMHRTSDSGDYAAMIVPCGTGNRAF